MKNIFNKIILFHLAILITLLTSCENFVTGEGPIIDIKKNVENFSKLDLQIDAEVTITQGTANNVVITAQNNIAEAIYAVVSGGKLKVYTDKNLVTTEPIIINITMSSVEEIEISGSGIIKSKGIINAPELDLEVSGSGKIFLNAVCNKIETSISGSGEVTLKGSSIDSELDISGSGKLAAYDFATQNNKVDISGSGNADVTVTQNLIANISGSGNVNYKGNPAKVKSDVNGSGTIHVAD